MTNLNDLMKRRYDISQATNKFDTALRVYVHDVEKVPVLTDDAVWFETNRLVRLIRSGLKFRPTFHSALEYAADEFFRAPLVNARTTEVFHELARYVGSYERMKGRIYKALSKVDKVDLGDDSFGDLVDSLPLAGSRICGLLLSGCICYFSELELELDTLSFKKNILNGENYVAMNLMDALNEKMVIPAQDMYRPCDGCEKTREDGRSKDCPYCYGV